jgi:hypothetical protein
MYDDIKKPHGAEYNYHKKICDAAIHPVTGEVALASVVEFSPQ